MDTILYVYLSKKHIYNKCNFFTKIIDAFKTRYLRDIKIKELDILIKRVEIPSNLNDVAYEKNLSRILSKFDGKYNELSLNGKNLYSINYISKFQRQFISYSVVQSIKVVLMNLNKSIKNSNILVDIDDEKILISILEELAIESRNVILLNNSVNKIEKIRETIMSKYGLSIEVILHECNVLNIDFVVTSKNKEYRCNNVWHINNYPKKANNYIDINNVLYKVPWEIPLKEMPPQLIASIIRKQKNESIPEILKNNDIILESILYNDDEITIGHQ